MRSLPLLFLLCLSLCACREGENEASARGGSVAARAELPLSSQCGGCHAREFSLWQGSHHALAWRKPHASQESEPFQLQHSGMSAGHLLFREPASGGQSYRVVAAMGHTPLVQYVVEGERGALQCTAAAWDVQRREWFDTVADDARLRAEGHTERRPGDWGHWLGRGMCWNARCAACHVSGFEKRYDAAADSYDSRWQEPGVTCIQCHSLADTPTAPSGRPVRRNKGKTVSPQQQAASCATCHARREELRPGFREGELFEDYYRLELPLVEGVFWPNGMQRDECYTETGMRLSPMGQAGVTCMDCHDAHSGKTLRPVEDNALCLHCHGQAGKQVNGTPVPTIDMTTHTPCPPTSKGGRCVECHMPESLYMARDARRDHAFTSPDPQLSAELGHPNACTQCHADKDHAWASAAVERVYGPAPRMARYRDRTRAVAAAMRGEGNTVALLAAYRAETNPTWQATLMELLARQAPQESIHAAARQAANSPSPLLRAAAAAVLGDDAPQLLTDPVRLVRHAAAWAQRNTLTAAATPHPALAELEESLRYHADHPAALMQQAVLAKARARYARSRGDAPAAEQQAAQAEEHYRKALALDPASATARMDFALFLAQEERPLDALEQLLACTAAHPNNAEAQYRLALLLQELGHSTPARKALEKALHLAPGHARARRVREEWQQAAPLHPQSPTTP